LLALALGCGGATSPSAGPEDRTQTEQAAPAADTAATGEEVDDSTADVVDHHRHHHHGGFSMFIAMSLDSIGVTPDQHDAIAKIQSEMHAKMQPAHDAEKAVLLALADGVAAGQVDRGKLDGAVAQLSSTSAGVHDAMIESLNALHHTLTPPQRQALVDKVEAHAEVWHHSNTSEAARDAKAGHLEKLAKELALSPEQVEKIRAGFSGSIGKVAPYDRGEADAHFQAFASAFTKDAFDAKALRSGGAVNAHMATWGVVRLVHLYEAAAPVLTPEQRTKAADALRRHANYKRTDQEG
jgi:Spy/CpxP family protein refolding chaperone